LVGPCGTILGIIHVNSSNGESCTPQFMTALGSIAKHLQSNLHSI